MTAARLRARVRRGNEYKFSNKKQVSAPLPAFFAIHGNGYDNKRENDDEFLLLLHAAGAAYHN